MIERTEAFKAAEYRVKVSHFTRKGYDLGKVVHVGANEGYEIEWYLQLGATHVIVFEPLLSPVANLVERWHGNDQVTIFPFALGRRVGRERLAVTQGDGQGSSFLSSITEEVIVGYQDALVIRYDKLDLELGWDNTLVIDVQGMEKDVLIGFGDRLNQFNFLNIECSREPVYYGGHTASEVEEYLWGKSSGKRFVRDSPIEDHNDVMFLRMGV